MSELEKTIPEPADDTKLTAQTPEENKQPEEEVVVEETIDIPVDKTDEAIPTETSEETVTETKDIVAEDIAEVPDSKIEEVIKVLRVFKAP